MRTPTPLGMDEPRHARVRSRSSARGGRRGYTFEAVGAVVFVAAVVMVVVWTRKGTKKKERYAGPGEVVLPPGFGSYARPAWGGGPDPSVGARAAATAAGNPTYDSPFHWLYYRPFYAYGQPDYAAGAWWRYPYSFYYGPWSRPTMQDASQSVELCRKQCSNAEAACGDRGHAAAACARDYRACATACDANPRWYAY